MIRLDDNQDTDLTPWSGSMGRPTLSGLEGADEPMNVQQEYMAQRRALENDRLSKLYTDEKEFARLSNDPRVRESSRLSLLGNDLPKVGLNAAYLSHQLGRKVTASEYEIARDHFAASQFGKEAVTDGQFFDLVKGQYDLRNQKIEAVRELRLRMAAQSLEDGIGGAQTPVASTWTAWKEKHAELLDGEEDLPYLAAAVADRNEFQQVVDKYKGLAAPGLALLKRFTAGETDSQDMADFARTLAESPVEDQDKVIELIALAADGGQIDRGDLKEFAKSFGQTFSRGFNFIPQSVLQQKETGVTAMVEAVEGGTKVWVLPDGDLSRAVVSSTDPDTGYEMKSGWREATPEERQTMVEGGKQSLSVFRIERQLRAVADNNVDPIKRLAPKNSFLGWLEGSAQGVVGSLPLLSMAAINPVVSALAYQSREYDRLMLENRDMDVRAATTVAGIEGGWQAALDMLQLRILAGALPATGKLLGKIKSTGVRKALGYPASGLEQFGQELAQDIGTKAIDAVASAVREDMKDQSFTLEVAEYWKNDALEVLGASLIFGLWGGRAVSSRDLKGTPAQWDEAARVVGISEQGRERMQAATTPEELDAVVERELKAVTPEARAAGALYAKAKAQSAAAAQADPNEPTLEVGRDEEGNTTYTIRTPDDQVLIETKDAQAAQAAFLDYRTASQNNEVEALRQAIDVWQNREKGLEFKDAPGVLVTEELGRLEGIGDTARIEQLRQRLVAADIDPDGDLTGVQIFGSVTVEAVGQGVYRGTSLLRQGATPETVFEEGNHYFVRRALLRGDVTLDTLTGWLDQTAAATGLDIKRGNEIEVIESIAQVGMDLFNGRLDQTQIPQGLMDYFRRLMRVIKEIYVRAVKVTEAFDKGEIDANFEQFLMESMGLSPQQQVDLNSSTNAAAVATGQPMEDFSIGITVAPLRRDTLTELSKKELGKRARSAKFVHLQQVVDDITAAYGVRVLSRQPVIGTWTEKGQVSLEVPEALVIDTDDFALAEEIAALVAISAPEMQNAALVWRPDLQGDSHAYSFKAKNAAAALQIAQNLEAAGIQGSSYDVNTRTFTLVSPGGSATVKQTLDEFLDEQFASGAVAGSSKTGVGLTQSNGRVSFPSEQDYQRHIDTALQRADSLGGQQGAAIRDVVSRAQRRLDRQAAATKIAGKARRALKKLTQPQTAAARIEAELKGRAFDNIRQLGLYLDARFRQIHGKPAFEIGSQEGIDLASEALVYDILDGLSTDGSGMGWYDERVQETIRELAKQHPEFADDPLALSVYIGILASTSQGYTVVENFKQADRVYAVYKATGRMPADLEFAKGNDPINSNLAQIQELIDTYGLEGYAEFMDAEVTGQALRDQYGMQPTGVTLQDVVRGNRVLGPKIGSFFNNLRGRFDTITMDLWYTRTMHRYLGETVVPLESEKMQNAIAKFRTELKKEGARTYGLDLKEALKDDESTVQAALTLFQRWARGNNDYAEKGYMKFKDGYAVEKAARTIFASGGMKGAPQNKSHRNYFASIVLEAKAKLAKLGFKLTEADMQAVVWYREKNLFGRTGVANAAAKPADYLDAVMVARRKAEAQEDVDPAELAEELGGATFDYSIGRVDVRATVRENFGDGIPRAIPLDAAGSVAGSGEGSPAQPGSGAAALRPAARRTGNLGIPAEKVFAGIRYAPARKWALEELAYQLQRGRRPEDSRVGPPIYFQNYAGNKAAFDRAAALVEQAYREVVLSVDLAYADRYGTPDRMIPRTPQARALFTDDAGKVHLIDAPFGEVELDPGDPAFSVGRPRVARALSAALNRKPGERLAMYERAKEMFDRVAARRGAETGASGYARTLQSLWELDAILKVLPAEVRGKVGGFTSIAALEPTDLYRGAELVTESNSPAGARIAAWMREGLNIGEAGKKAELPPGYSTRRATDPARATKATDDFLVKRIATVGKQLDRYLAAEYRIAIERALEAAKAKRSDAGVRKSTLGPETQAYADKALAASNLDNDQTAARLAAIEAELLNPETKDEARIDLVEEWGLVNTLGDLDSRNAETLAQAYAELRDRFKAGRAGWRIQEEARIAGQRETVATLLAGFGEPTKAKRFAQKSQVQELVEKLSAVGLDHGNFEQVLRAVFGDHPVVEKWSTMMRKADNGDQDMEMAVRDQLLGAIKTAAKAAGMRKGQAFRLLKTKSALKVRALDGKPLPPERISIELAQKIVRGLADRSNLTAADVAILREKLDELPPDTRKEFITFDRAFVGNPSVVELTPAQAIQLELSWDQPDVQEKMRREGWTDESIEDIRAITSQPVAAETLAFLRKFYAENYATVNPIYARMFGMNMPQAKFYAPSRYKSVEKKDDIGLDGSPQVTGSTPGFAKSRVGHSAPIDPVDALTVFQQHAVQTAHWIHFAEFSREVRGVLSNLPLQEAIEQKFGRPVLQSLQAWLDQIEQRGANKSREMQWMNAAMGAYLSGTSVSSLGFNLRTVAINSDSGLRFLWALTPQQIGSALMTPAKLAQAMPKVWFSPSVQRRIKGGSNPAAQFVFTRGAAKPGPFSTLGWFSFQPVQWYDAAATTFSSAMVFQATYNDAMAAGLGEVQAEAAALEAVDAVIYRYSQPTGFGSKSNVENTSGAFGKLLTLFMSDPRLKTGVMLEAVREIGRGKDVAMNVQKLLVVETLAIVSHVIASAYRDAFSDDEDEDIWSPEGFALAMVLAPFQGLFLAGAVTETAFRMILGMKTWAPPTAPYAGNIEALGSAVRNWEQLFSPDTFADGVNAWNRLLRGLAINAPFAAPAALLNMIKPFVGLQENLEADE